MRIGGSNVALNVSYESPRVDSQKARVRMWIGDALSNQNAHAQPFAKRTPESDNEKKFDPALLDWFIFLKSKNPGGDPMAGVEGVEEIRRLYKKAGPSYVAPPPPVAKATKATAKPETPGPVDVVA